ncbi:bifunctional chorismate mutase/prephenate dehydratase [Neiella marina]|uniref:Bifunctional chorismate mutase/prephenate dehydratase n=1 Tax=Neiella marina TaxID=508461 RepID=A0A8J2XMN5_9GAMM|nr:chorismate mutase [Neiella marina]GGA65569.1 bifunctional chorismate mutase/prephenate dehydratase [Neiella marina]
MSSPDLNEVRLQISQTDSDLLKLLAQRRALSIEVAKSKLASSKPIRDTSREQQLLVELIEQGKPLELDSHYVTQVFHSVIEDSVLLQQAYLQQHINPETIANKVRVAFLGQQGSYSHLAAHKYFARRAEEVIEHGCKNFKEIIAKVENGLADYALLPIENTSSGGINEVYDVLQHTSLHIIGELSVPVEHCLLVATDTTEEKIRTIYSHFQPIAQCSDYLGMLSDVTVERTDATSHAFEVVANMKRDDVAAIGNAEGGRLYGLTPIRTGLANQAQNFSRFIVIARKPVDVAEQIPAKTTFIMSVKQRPGALVDALLILKQNNINMCKLESRPIPGNPWEEMFYVDVECNVKSSNMQLAMEQLQDITTFIKVLGCYPSDDIKPTEPELD